ncbi:response regulator [Spirosoma sp. RP8]|uniref:Response regulator n=1 Tax=Spirosoma liriopis TaxID=2937440 RepID=A0ABT0HS41_9BACT|nr:response regulator [Spirosoma liriopis]MCK8495000.1 response regulator [Spirosoma liriopis]
MRSFKIQLAQYRAQVTQTIVDLLEQNSLAPTTYSESILAQFSKPTILVIEDNVDEWFLIRWMLSKQFQEAEPVWLSSADQAIAYLNSYGLSEKSLPVMILLDLYLPTAEAGLALLESIKANPLFDAVPVITISRSNDGEDRTSAFDRASNDYVVKPANYKDWQQHFSLLINYWEKSVL